MQTGKDYTTNFNDRNIVNLMVVNPLDIKLAPSFVDNDDILTRNASI